MIQIESEHRLAFPRAAVWPILSKTDWLNRAIGLPPVEYDIAARPEGGSSVSAQARVAGLAMRWREHPFEWLEPEFYRVHREFERGPIRQARLGLEFHEADGGTRVVVRSAFEPRNALAALFVKNVLGPKATRDMRKVIAHVEQHLRGSARVVLPDLPVHPVHEAALQSGLTKLRAAGQPESLVARLEMMLREAPDVELAYIRPFAVARAWGSDPWETLALFLHATRSGLLDFGWEVLCPQCRSSRAAPARSLSGLKRTSHCDVCQIEFDAQFDKSVELKFAVNPAIRPRETQTFCLAGPGGKTHVLSQLWLQPGEQREWRIPQQPRPLRLRSPQVTKSFTLDASDDAPDGQRLVVTCDPAALVVTREAAPTPDLHARIVNPNSFPILLCMERLAWSDDILTAARVTNWQEFRDLFASEVISPQEQVSVGFQVVLFTDLRGSTATYRRLGDAPAYAMVRDHFAVLAAAIGAHHGGIVKTIGDAVMATFSRIDEALTAISEIHAKLPGTNPVLDAHSLKASLHVGPCLAVNANDRLDFFGTTINLAARMVECCEGGDLAVSDELFHRPEMAAFLNEHPSRPQKSEMQFRGFEHALGIWRIKFGGPCDTAPVLPR